MFPFAKLKNAFKINGSIKTLFLTWIKMFPFAKLKKFFRLIKTRIKNRFLSFKKRF